MITIDTIAEALKSHCLSFGTRVVPRGHLRIDTKLLYPDGAFIGVFVDKDALDGDPLALLSDFGGTFAKLAEYGMKPHERLQTIEESIRPLGVRVFEDQLTYDVSDLDSLSDGVITLAQACLRISDLIFIRRQTQQRSFTEEIGEIIERTNLPTVERHKFKIPNLRPITVDYRVKGPSRHSSVLALGPTHVAANEVFRKWYDLRRAQVHDSFVTVYDDRQVVEHKEDLIRLQAVSDVVPLSSPEKLEHLLAA